MARVPGITKPWLLLPLALSTGRLVAQTDTIYGGPAVLPSEVAETFIEAMRTDLRNLVASQEAYFADHNRYARVFTYGNQKGATIQPSLGVTLILTYATARGWTARAVHSLLPRRSCVVEVGDVPVSRRLRTTGGQSTRQNGVPTCDAT
jgi:hypothetical protein